MSVLINLKLTEPSPQKDGYEYGYTVFEQLPDIYVDSSKCKLSFSVDLSSIDATNDTTMKMIGSKDIQVHLSLSTEELIDGQNNDTFCTTVVRLINDKKMPPQLNILYVVVDSCIKL